MSQVPPKTVSELLAHWHAGDDDALRAAVPLVYDELRRIAHHYLRNERPGHTLRHRPRTRGLSATGEASARFRSRTESTF